MTVPVPPPECPRTPEAGAYLLGALAPTERVDFAEHLSGCISCLREVGQLAGLPGLLARAPGSPQGAPLPAPEARGEPGAVAEALAEIRRRRTRGRVLAAAAVVLVAAMGVGAAALTPSTDRAPVASAPVVTGVSAARELPVHMETVGDARAWGELALADRPWGTEVVMRCRYDGVAPWGAPVYVLVATDREGQTTELARWSAVRGEDVVLATTTELPRPQLASLEVRSTTGRVVLRTDMA